MEFLQTNWFPLLMVVVLVIDRAVTRGKHTEKMEQVIAKVDEMEETLGGVAEKVAEHVGNSDMHVTQTLTDLFRERNDYVKTELANTRRDVRRIEEMLQKM